MDDRDEPAHGGRGGLPGNAVAGLVLIAVGAALLLIEVADVGGEILLLLLGLVLLAVYVARRSYGILVAGAILTGLGGGLVAAGAGAHDASVVVGLGAGFVLIAVVDRLVGAARTGWWWALIPGGVLLLVGLSEVTGRDDLLDYLIPGSLIVIGVFLLFGRGQRSRPGTRGGAAGDGLRDGDRPT